MIFENQIAQCLVSNGHRLFFYTNYNKEKKRNDIEIDFILLNAYKTKQKIYPIEVKTSKKFTTKSLDNFIQKYKNRIGTAYIISPKNLYFEGNVLCIPSYMAICL